jgi:hypothetical protein
VQQLGRFGIQLIPCSQTTIMWQTHIDRKEIWNRKIIYHHINYGGKTLRVKDNPKGSTSEVMMK